MNLMGCRLINLERVFYGYLRTGVSLIEWNGTILAHNMHFDDIGIYIIIPRLAHFFSLPIMQAIDLFFYIVLLLPPFIGMCGFFLLYHSWIQRSIAAGCLLLLTRVAYGLGDVYLAYYATAIAIIPWVLYWAQRRRYDTFLLTGSFLCGFWIALCHYIRAYSGIGALIFAGIMLATSSFLTKKQKVAVLLCGVLGALPVIGYMQYTYRASVDYVTQHLPHSAVAQPHHVFWHNIYLGFGFLKHNNDIEYRDGYGEEKAKEKGVAIEQADQYEKVIRNEIIDLIQHHTTFVLFTFFAKLGIMFFLLLKFANVGLLASFFVRKPWQLELSFWSALLFYALFPLLTMPTLLEYSLGFITCAVLYAVVSINYAIEQKWHHRVWMALMRRYA